MALLHIEPLPRRAGKSDVLALLDAAGLDRRHVGRIELHGKQAVVEIPDGSEARLVKALDGRQFGDRRVRAWTSSPPTAGPSDEDEFLRLGRLLDLESCAEAQKAAEHARRLSPEAAQQTGNTLLNLVVVDEEAGLGGRYLVHLGRRGRAPLLWTRLGVGSPVVLSPQAAKAAQPHRGVVCDRSERTICAALDRLPEDLADHDAWRLDLSFDEVATQRQRAALEQARLARGDRFAILRDVLLGARQPEFGVDPQVRPLDAEPQRRCSARRLQFALSARRRRPDPRPAGHRQDAPPWSRSSARRSAGAARCWPAP